MEYYVLTAYGVASAGYSNLIKWFLGVEKRCSITRMVVVPYTTVVY
jgi:hypothetical protein